MEELAVAVSRALGSRPVSFTPRAGGYSTADRYAVELADGRSVFAKSSATPHLADWLRREHEVYVALAASFMPKLLGWDDDGERATLVIEDLSDADWSVRWDAGRVDAVLEAIGMLAASAPPAGTPTIRELFPDIWGRWETVAADPAPFLGLGLRDARWLERTLPDLLAAVEVAEVEGDALCHYDIRSDNLCFRDGKAILVDWNWCCRANPRADISALPRACSSRAGRRRGSSCPDAGSSRGLRCRHLGGGRRAAAAGDRADSSARSSAVSLR